MLSVKIAFKNIFIKIVLLFVLNNYIIFVLYSYTQAYTVGVKNVYVA